MRALRDLINSYRRNVSKFQSLQFKFNRLKIERMVFIMESMVRSGSQRYRAEETGNVRKSKVGVTIPEKYHSVRRCYGLNMFAQNLYVEA